MDGGVDAGAAGVGTGAADGVTWHQASVPSIKGEGFESVAAGAAGLVATSTQPGYVPGLATLWTSHDGRTWTHVKGGPLGVITSGEGTGSALGTFSGDGTRLLATGITQDGGPIEYRVSADGSTWTTLSLTGGGAATVTGPNAGRPFLLRGGILFSGASTAWIGDAVGP